MPVYEIEKRTIRTEVRAVKDKFELSGTAASFNINSQNLGGFVERIAPTAFTRSLAAKADVKATFNHDPSQILGRTKSGTLQLSADDKGLNFRCILDPTNTDHQNIYRSVARGDLDSCSFAFVAPPNGSGETWTDGALDEKGNSCKLRTLTDVDLKDVAVVSYPAYNAPDATSVSARAAAAAVLTEEQLAAAQGLTVSQMRAASDKAKDSTLRARHAKLGRELQETDAQRKARAARLGAQIQAEAIQDKKDEVLRERMETASGRTFRTRRQS